MLRNCDKHLFSAIERNDAKGVLQSLYEGANVNAVDQYSRRRGSISPLTRACWDGNCQIVRILLDAGADSSWKEEIAGMTAASIACARGHLTVVQMLINYDSDLLKCGGPELLCAGFRGHSEICRFLVKSGCNLDATNQQGDTALIFAAKRGFLEFVRVLLMAGVDVESCNNVAMTALHGAAWHGRVDVIRELIQHNADICPLNEYGRTPFDLTCSKNDRDVATDLLIQMYSDRLSKENEGRLALHTLLRTAEYSFADFVKYGEVHPPMHPLRVKIQLGTLTWKHWRTLILSIDKKMLRRRDANGRLPIHIACQSNAPVEFLVTLVERDPDTLCMADHAGKRPLFKFLRRFRDTPDFAGALRWLVDRGGVGTLAARNQNGALPLHEILRRPPITKAGVSLSVVQYLIQGFPRSVNMRTNAGLYPFMMASSNASLSVLYEIIRAFPGLLVPR